MPDHLRPTNPIAPAALLPGDPARAMALAQEILTQPLMSNHARGLWGYGGETASGLALTVQATGIGGPSVAIVLEELADLGVRRAVRIGTCRALTGGLALGDLLVADSARAGAGAVARPDGALTGALLAAGEVAGATVASTDAYYDPGEADRDTRWREAGALAVDLGTAALLDVGSRLGIAVASALVVSRDSAGETLDDHGVTEASKSLARLAVAALSDP